MMAPIKGSLGIKVCPTKLFSFQSFLSSPHNQTLKLRLQQEVGSDSLLKRSTDNIRLSMPTT